VGSYYTLQMYTIRLHGLLVLDSKTLVPIQSAALALEKEIVVDSSLSPDADIKRYMMVGTQPVQRVPVF
jgi:hypothetical protein